ncbi:hypothetical protein V1281_001291 [Nitrobacteraceae bacterium AZCC 2161]
MTPATVMLHARGDAMLNVGHGFAGRDAANAAVNWISERFAGNPAPSDCGRS